MLTCKPVKILLVLFAHSLKIEGTGSTIANLAKHIYIRLIDVIANIVENNKHCVYISILYNQV